MKNPLKSELQDVRKRLDHLINAERRNSSKVKKEFRRLEKSLADAQESCNIAKSANSTMREELARQLDSHAVDTRTHRLQLEQSRREAHKAQVLFERDLTAKKQLVVQLQEDMLKENRLRLEAEDKLKHAEFDLIDCKRAVEKFTGGEGLLKRFQSPKRGSLPNMFSPHFRRTPPNQTPSTTPSSPHLQVKLGDCSDANSLSLSDSSLSENDSARLQSLTLSSAGRRTRRGGSDASLCSWDLTDDDNDTTRSNQRINSDRGRNMQGKRKSRLHLSPETQHNCLTTQRRTEGMNREHLTRPSARHPPPTGLIKHTTKIDAVASTAVSKHTRSQSRATGCHTGAPTCEKKPFRDSVSPSSKDICSQGITVATDTKSDENKKVPFTDGRDRREPIPPHSRPQDQLHKTTMPLIRASRRQPPPSPSFVRPQHSFDAPTSAPVQSTSNPPMRPHSPQSVMDLNHLPQFPPRVQLTQELPLGRPPSPPPPFVTPYTITAHPRGSFRMSAPVSPLSSHQRVPNSETGSPVRRTLIEPNIFLKSNPTSPKQPLTFSSHSGHVAPKAMSSIDPTPRESALINLPEADIGTASQRVSRSLNRADRNPLYLFPMQPRRSVPPPSILPKLREEQVSNSNESVINQGDPTQLQVIDGRKPQVNRTSMVPAGWSTQIQQHQHQVMFPGFTHAQPPNRYVDVRNHPHRSSAENSFLCLLSTGSPML
eukprot:GHVN01013489.1.p1 GENE.GHVN01013489.1~~GHVN01013489.1.p1  ORF type:complete len:711 (-),score=96.49 GHVN01013489.1:1414-3546(-)